MKIKLDRKVGDVGYIALGYFFGDRDHDISVHRCEIESIEIYVSKTRSDDLISIKYNVKYDIRLNKAFDFFSQNILVDSDLFFDTKEKCLDKINELIPVHDSM